jgi:hypothetical protein
VEGACKEGGRGPSIWDAFSHTEGNFLFLFLFSTSFFHNKSGLMWMNLIFCNFLKLFVHSFVLLGKIIDKSNGDLAVDQYHRYKVSNNVLSDSLFFCSFVVDWPCNAYMVISPFFHSCNITMLVSNLSSLSSGCTITIQEQHHSVVKKHLSHKS